MLTLPVSKCLNWFHLRVFYKRFITEMPHISKVLPCSLQDNLKESQNLIYQLKGEIKQLMTTLQKENEVLNIKRLQEENDKLEREVNLIKKELTQLEIANGVQQVPVPGGEEGVEKQLPISQVEPVTSSEKFVLNNTVQVSSNVENSEKKQAKALKPKKSAPPPAEELPVDVGRLDIRVGQILSAKIHPDADQLYVENIDVGEETTRTVVSGLVKFVSLSELEKRMVLVLCNLKPQKMRGIESQAMVLCASTPEKVELLCPPPGAKAGDKVTVPGFTRNPDLPFMNPKKKIFEKVAEDLKLDSGKRASFRNVPWEIEGKPGDITAQTLSGCHIK